MQNLVIVAVTVCEDVKRHIGIADAKMVIVASRLNVF